MFGSALLISLAVTGVDFGWDQTPDGQFCYIVQVSPDQIANMREDAGVIVESRVPKHLQNKIQKIRIQVGNNALPRIPADPEDALRPTPASSIEDSNFTNSSLQGPLTNSSASDDREYDEDDSNSFSDQRRTTSPLSDRLSDTFATQSEPEPNGWAPLSNPKPKRRIGFSRDDDRPFTPTPSYPYKGSLTANRSDDHLYASFDGYPINSRSLGSTSIPGRSDSSIPLGAERKWGVLLATLLCLCASVALNFYLGWLAWGYYLRYRDVIEQLRSTSWSPMTARI